MITTTSDEPSSGVLESISGEPPLLEPLLLLAPLLLPEAPPSVGVP
jgi:hypothetical protein